MPFIHVRTNQTVQPKAEKEIVKRLGASMPLIGKSERWLMTQCEAECHLSFQGESDQPIAFISVALFGSADDAAYDAMTKEITSIVSDTLGVSPDHIYVQYQEAHTWGWNGSNF